jgi:hypothetical protein
MDNLERRVETLEQLPERVMALEAQIVQLRDEMRSEFSATRAETRAGDEETRRTLREEIRAGDEETRRTLREEIRAGDEETRRVLTTRMDDLFGANERHMRLLHEDLVQRIATLKEDRQR